MNAAHSMRSIDPSSVVTLAVPTDCDPILCHCLGVRESEVVSAFVYGAALSVREVGHCTGAGTGCRACRVRITECLRRVTVV